MTLSSRVSATERQGGHGDQKRADKTPSHQTAEPSRRVTLGRPSEARCAGASRDDATPPGRALKSVTLEGDRPRES